MFEFLESNWFFYVCCYYSVAFTWTFTWRFFLKPGFEINGKHVFISGGSTGLGLALAKKCVKNGANVTVISRSQAKLDAARKELDSLKITLQQNVTCISCDVTQKKSVEEVIESLKSPIDVVMNVAGLSNPGYFYEQSSELFAKQMDLNYQGTVNVSKACLDNMFLHNVKNAKFVFVSSAMAILSFAGYSQYAATKYALRGFCDGLRGELASFDYSSHIYFAANIDSPGFLEENKTKPELTKMIEGSASLQSTEEVAAALWSGIELGQYQVTNDIAVEVLRMVNNGMAPRNNFMLELPLVLPLTIFQQLFFLYIELCTKLYPVKRNTNKKQD